MSRKTRAAERVAKAVPVQIKHLRFVTSGSGPSGEDEILNTGGYTIAYRCIDLRKADAELQEALGSTTGLAVRYGYAECHLDDNYDKKKGRARATARLDNNAPEWSHVFLLELERPSNEDDVIPLKLGTAVVDLRGLESQLVEEVVLNFIAEWQELLYNGSTMENFNNYLIDHKGTLALDAEVLLTSASEEDDEDDLEGADGNGESAIYMQALNAIGGALVDLRELLGQLPESVPVDLAERLYISVETMADLVAVIEDSDDSDDLDDIDEDAPEVNVEVDDEAVPVSEDPAVAKQVEPEVDELTAAPVDADGDEKAS